MTGRIRIGALLMVVVGVGSVADQRTLAQPLKTQQPAKAAAQIIQPDQEDEFLKGALPSKTEGLVAPVVTRRSDPKYTAFALRARIQGDVKIQAVIGPDGRVERARVKESLHPDLDQEALKAFDQWHFEAGRLNGQPARVVVEVDMTFRVH